SASTRFTKGKEGEGVRGRLRVGIGLRARSRAGMLQWDCPAPHLALALALALALLPVPLPNPPLNLARGPVSSSDFGIASGASRVARSGPNLLGFPSSSALQLGGKGGC